MPKGPGKARPLEQEKRGEGDNQSITQLYPKASNTFDVVAHNLLGYSPFFWECLVVTIPVVQSRRFTAYKLLSCHGLRLRARF